VIFDEDEIIQVSSGGFHTLFLIKSLDKLKLFGLGKVNRGQLAYRRKSKNEPQQTFVPKEICLDVEGSEIKQIGTGGLVSFALVGEKQEKVRKAKEKKTKIEMCG
jgi:hypothetical protein